MKQLTPYDTGHRLEPKPWITDAGIVRYRAGLADNTDDFGKVDFDDDEGTTRATVWIERQADGLLVMHVSKLWGIKVVEE